MPSPWTRAGDLKDLASYPLWVREIVAGVQGLKAGVAGHPLFRQMRDAALPPRAAANFLIRVWPVIEQFPQYMGRNLAKLQFGKPGHDLARAFLTRNVRLEQNHAAHWVAWAEAGGVPYEALLRGSGAAQSAALAHWCWYICDRGSLAEAVAATNYAIEGATGEWAQLVCSSDRYAASLPEEKRKSGLRWLRAHARYDDSHPWEALEIVASILGANPGPRDVEAIRAALGRSYDYMRLILDDCLADTDEGCGETGATQERAA
ncbi:MAG: iron-containing redox enzyme family protein [Gammaproteobacteria bacterium]|nr:iron-containing redox enzyme family protein [Gammaproteobacteria bacterium]